MQVREQTQDLIEQIKAAAADAVAAAAKSQLKLKVDPTSSHINRILLGLQLELALAFIKEETLKEKITNLINRFVPARRLKKQEAEKQEKLTIPVLFDQFRDFDGFGLDDQQKERLQALEELKKGKKLKNEVERELEALKDEMADAADITNFEYRQGFPSFKAQVCELAAPKYKDLMQYIGHLYTMAYVLDMFDVLEQQQKDAKAYLDERCAAEEQLQKECKAAEGKFAAVKNKVTVFCDVAKQKANEDVAVLDAQIKELVIERVTGLETKVLPHTSADFKWFSTKGNAFVNQSKKAFDECEATLVSLNAKIKAFSDDMAKATNADTDLATRRTLLVSELNQLSEKFTAVQLPVLSYNEFFSTLDSTAEAKQAVLTAIDGFNENEAKAIRTQYALFSIQKEFRLNTKPQSILGHYLPVPELEGATSAFKKHKEFVEQKRAAINCQLEKLTEPAESPVDLSLLELVVHQVKSFVSPDAEAHDDVRTLAHFGNFLEKVFFPDYWEKVTPDCFQTQVTDRVKAVVKAQDSAAQLSKKALKAIHKFCLELNAGTEKKTARESGFKRKAVVPGEQKDSLCIMDSKVAQLKSAVASAHEIYRNAINKAEEKILAQCEKMSARLEENRRACISHIEAQRDALAALDLSKIASANLAKQKPIVNDEKATQQEHGKGACSSPLPALVLGPISAPSDEGRGSKVTVAEALPEDKTFRLPSARGYKWGSGLSGAATVAFAVATICLLVSNPAGWIAGLAVAALACCVIAIKSALIAHERTQVNNYLSPRPVPNQRKLYNQNNKLKADGVVEETRNFMMKHQIVKNDEQEKSHGADVTQNAVRYTILNRPEITIHGRRNGNRYNFFSLSGNDEQPVNENNIEDIVASRNTATFT